MSSTAASLVRRINQFLGGGNPHWNGSSKRLAVEYTELIEQLGQRFNLAQLQIDLEDFEEARAALHQPEPLMMEIRALQFPRRLDWERLVRTHLGPFRKLVTLDEVLRLEKLVANKSGPGLSKRPLQENRASANGFPSDPRSAAKQIASEAGFAGRKSPVWIRMIPLVGAIMIIGLALVLIAALGPGFFSKREAGNEEALTPEQLANLNGNPGNPKPNPGEIAFAPGKKEKDKEQDKGQDKNPDRDKDAPEGPKANPANKNLNDENKEGIGPKGAIDPPGNPKGENQKTKMDQEKGFKDNKGNGQNKNQEIPPEPILGPGMIRSPEIALLDGWISQFAIRDSGLKLKNWLQLDKDTANKAAVDGLLQFIRADFGIVGRKPPLEWKELPDWIAAGRSLNQDSKDLFDPEKLKSMMKFGKQAESDLVDWFNKVIVSETKLLRFISDKQMVIHPEALFSFAANVDIVDDLTRFIDRKMIEYEGGRPKKVNAYMAVILREKRDLKNRSNEELLADIVAINTELKRRVRSARFPWKTEPQ